MKKSYFALAVVVLVVVGFLVFKRNNSRVVTETPKKEKISAYVTSSGNVEALGKLDVFPTTNGVLEEVYVKNGDAVKIGQKLFKVRSTASAEDRARAYAAYQTSVSALKTAEQSLVSLKADIQSAESNLWSAQAKERNVVSGEVENRTNPSTGREYTSEEVKQAKSSVEAARDSRDALKNKQTQIESSISSAKSSVSSAWLDYQSTESSTVTSTAPGVVSNLIKSISDNVEVKRTSPSGDNIVDPVLILSNKETLYIYTDITELKVSKVLPGQEVLINLDAFPTTSFNGVVMHVDDIGRPVEGVTSYKVMISFDSDQDLKEVRSGMSATVTIKTQEKDNVLTIPNNAILVKDNKYFVKAIQDDKEIEKEVQIGIKGNLRTEVLSGISENDKIVIPAK
jgi:multidrug efflux pump subunit AcrA (membrane-fusion protein)